jgi:hypothetical protein
MPRFGSVALSCLLACVVPAFAADPPPDADRLKALEKQVADLKKEVADLRELMKLPPKTATNKKLYGSWGMEKAPDAKYVGVVAVVLNEDGTYDVAWQNSLGKNETWSGKFKVVGKVVELTYPSSEYNAYLHVTSVDEKELIGTTKYKFGEGEMKLQRQ